jgi:WD40 repeat protein
VNRRLRVLVVGVTLLALVAATFGGVARQQWQRSQEAQEALSVEAAQARSQELAASAVAAVGEDPALAKVLAVLGAEAAPPSFQSQDALHRTIVADRVVSRISMNHYTERLWAVLHPDGDRVAMTAESGFTPGLAIEVHDARTGDLVWEWVRPDEPGHESAVMAGAQYSPDGSLLASGVIWHPESNLRFGPPLQSAPPPAPGLVGVHLWDGRTHEPLGVLDVGPCGGWPLAMGGDHLLVRTLVAPPSRELSDAEETDLLKDCRWGDGAMGTLVVDRTTGESHLVTVVEALNLDLTVGHALSHDGSLAVVPDFANGIGLVVDTATGREVDRLEGLFGRDFDASGERLLVIDRSDTFRYIWRVLSVPELDTLTSFAGHEGASFYGQFGPDDASVFTTGLDNVTHQWDSGTGERLLTIPAAGSGLATTSADLVLVPRPDTTGAVLVDASPPGELWSLPSCQGPAVTPDRLRVAGDLVVVGRECDGQEVGRLETVTRSGTRVQHWAGVSWESFAVSPDGRLVVARHGAGTTKEEVPLLGPMRVLDLNTGEVEVTLQGFCDHTLPDFYTGIAKDDPALKTCGRVGDPPFTFGTAAVRWSPDGRWIVALEGGGDGAVVWDAGTGAIVASVLRPGTTGDGVWTQPYDATFSPDSGRLVVSTMIGALLVIDTETWETVAERQLEVVNRSSAGVVGYAADGSLVVVVPLRQNAANTRVLLVDPQTLVVRRVLSDVAEGTVQSAHLSPDGSRVALATTEGVVSVWDLGTQRLLDQADLGLGRLDGVQWLDDHDLVVLSSTGHLTTVTTDAERLLSLARDSLTRGLTRSECRSYEIDTCPSLASLQRSEPVVPEEIRGSYTLTWEDDELTEAAVTWAEDAFTELDADSLEALRGQAELMAGSYLLELGASDYSITRGDAGGVWCTGSVTTAEDRPDRLLLGADSGDRCLDFHYVEVGWEVDGDQLSFPREEFRGSYFDRILWTTKPLQKVDETAGS